MTISQTYKPIVPMFLQWYFIEVPYAIAVSSAGYVIAIAEIFPFVFLLKTLLSPWKNIVDRRVMHGIDLNLIAEKISLGLLARLVGFVVRVLTIVCGLFVESMTIIVCMVLLIAWLIFPALFIIGISLGIQLL